MNVKRLAAAALLLIAAAACQKHERSITGAYGDGFVSGQVVMASTIANINPAGVEVSVQGTGMHMVLTDDGRFGFASVPDEAVLTFRRASDGIDASTKVMASSMTVELAQRSATVGGSRRRSAPTVPATQFEGTIKTVVSETELLITTSHKSDVSVTLTPTTVIRHGQTAIAAADLKEGDRVHAKTTYSDKVYTALEIIVQNDGSEGGDAAAAVTANGNVLSLTADGFVVRTSSGREVTVQADTTTIIKKYGQTIPLSIIKVGDQVEVRGTAVDASTIKAVQIEVQDAGGRHGVVQLEGTVTDVGTSSLTVHTADGDFTVNTDTNTTIRKQGKSIAISDVHKDDVVTVAGNWVDDQTILATTITVRTNGGH